MSLLCTAEPFGYGPSSSLAQIVPEVVRAFPGVELVYIGQGHTLDFHREAPWFEGRVEECRLDGDDRARFRERCAGAEALLSVCDFEAAGLAREEGVPFLLYDPLTWYWKEIPEICREAALYLCQDFFGVRERLAREGFENAVVIPPLSPAQGPAERREGALISLGGLSNPYFTREKCTEYAGAVLRAAHGVLQGRGPLTSLTSKAVAEHVPGLEVATLTPPEVHARLAAVDVALLTPGLGQIYEASFLEPRTVWLPPANDSQGRQLSLIRQHGMAPGAVDWHDFLDVEPVDYRDEQAAVMTRLAGYMETLRTDEEARARLAACLEERLDAAQGAGENPLVGLATRFGRGGAAVAGRVLGGWLEKPARRQRPTWILPDAPEKLPDFPALAPLRLLRGNRAGAEVVEILRGLHEEVDGTGFHTLSATLELARVVRGETASPEAEDFARARRDFRLSGLELFGKYRAGHCTALAEVLRLRIQQETGLTGSILCVRHQDSLIPQELDWEDYQGTVHADLLVPWLEDGSGGLRAVHIVTGMGVGEHFHLFDEPAALSRHLAGLAYTLGAVVDPVELTREAFGYKNRLWVVRGPEVNDDSEKFGVDLIAGTAFLNRAAVRGYAGPGAEEERVGFPLGGDAAVLRDFLVAVREQFAQPEDFVDNLLFLGRNLDAYVEGVLCQPGRRLREAARAAG